MVMTKYEKDLLKFKKAEAKRQEAKLRKVLAQERMQERKIEREKEKEAKREKLKAENLELRNQRLKEQRAKRRMRKLDKTTKTIGSNLRKAFAPRQTSNSQLRTQERMMKLRLKQMKQQEKLMRMAAMSPPDHVRGSPPSSEDQWLASPSPEEMQAGQPDVPQTYLGGSSAGIQGKPFSGLLRRFSGFGGGGMSNLPPTSAYRGNMMSQLGSQQISLLGTPMDSRSMNPLHARNVMNVRGDPQASRLMRSEAQIQENIWADPKRKVKMRVW